uniref:Uncharacterized protein n=1 Tax=Knipowitschia caucasica TaxID=637954 RepID=A0AAV2MNE8_KNICA
MKSDIQREITALRQEAKADDISPEVGRLRASFNQVKPKLRDAGIPYSLYYPAKMTITVKGTRHVFTEPQAVEEFIRNIAPTANGDKDD